MAYRPTWQGHLKLSLVTCPVSLFTATNPAGDVHFNLINPKTHNRIKMITTDPETGPINRSDLVKGYEVSKGEYILLTDEEIKSVRLESTKTIDIERFVPAEDIDRIYWDSPHYLVPDGRTGIEAFAVIREAMQRQQQVALGKLVIQTRERLCAMEPREGCILLTTLRTHEDVRAPDSISGPRLPRPTAADVRSAKALIAKLHGKFDPKTFVDRYDKALRALVGRKKKGHEVKAVAPAEQESSNVIDLTEALRQSLGGKAQGTRTTSRRKTARRRHP